MAGESMSELVAGQHADVRIAIVRLQKPCQLCRESLTVGDVAEVRDRGGVHVACGITERRRGAI